MAESDLLEYFKLWTAVQILGWLWNKFKRALLDVMRVARAGCS